MSKRKTITVAGVPVTIQVINRELAVSVGRFGEAAGCGLLRTSPGSHGNPAPVCRQRERSPRPWAGR